MIYINKNSSQIRIFSQMKVKENVFISFHKLVDSHILRVKTTLFLLFWQCFAHSADLLGVCSLVSVDVSLFVVIWVVSIFSEEWIFSMFSDWASFESLNASESGDWNKTWDE
jgi:hypothetical protein